MANHFSDILTEPDQNSTSSIECVTRNIPTIVSRDQNLALLREITYEEVEEVFRNLRKSKAPSPNGFKTEFYQAAWAFIGTYIWELVKESRRSFEFYLALNSTLMSLIPKQENMDFLAGFRLIALCNVIYKILSTIMVNKLKPILSALISPK